MEKWREQLKSKPLHYWSRVEIEEIVKEKQIDRERFYEYSKSKYNQIVRKFYYSFMDYKNYPKVHLHYAWLHLRNELKVLYNEYIHSDFEKSLYKIKEKLSYNWNNKLFLILSDGWVYEGFIDEILSVLAETDGIIDEFYIVTPEYDKLVVYSDDSDTIQILEK